MSMRASSHNPWAATSTSTGSTGSLEENYGIGAKLLKQMGYSPGQGLGATGTGIVEPIQQKLRPSLLGVGGQSEQTEHERERSAAGKKEEQRKTKRLRSILSAVDAGLGIPPDVVSRLENANDSNLETLDQLAQQWLVFKNTRTQLELDISGLSRQSASYNAMYGLKTELNELLSTTTTNTLDQTIRRLLELQDSSEPIEGMGFAEVAVALIQVGFAQQVASWDICSTPVLPMTHTLRDLKPILMSATSTESMLDSPYVHLMGTVWLPKVLDAMSEQWSGMRNNAAFLLMLEEWDSVLPIVIRQAVITRTVLPSLELHFERNSETAHCEIDPWISYLGPKYSQKLCNHVIDYMSRAECKLATQTKLAIVYDWKNAIDVKTSTSFIRSHLFGGLARSIKPGLELPYEKSFLPKLLQQLCIVTENRYVDEFLKTSFFPEWKRVLVDQLCDSDNVDYGEISLWYQSWSDLLDSVAHDCACVKPSFRTGLAIINDAIDGHDWNYLVQRHLGQTTQNRISSTKAPAPAPESNKDLLETYCINAGLIFTPLHRTDPNTHNLLYRISNETASASLECYVTPKSVLYIKPKGHVEFFAVSLDDVASYLH